MAKISLSPLVVDIRNKIGDTVFSKWKGVNYARSRVVPSNPKSADQVEVRLALSRLVSTWQAARLHITAGWAAFASGRNLSGYNAFVGANAAGQRDADGLTLSKEFGTIEPLTTMTPSTGGGGGDVEIAFAPSPIPVNHKLIVMGRKIDGDQYSGVPEFGTINAAESSPQTCTFDEQGVVYEVTAALTKFSGADIVAQTDSKRGTATTGTD